MAAGDVMRKIAAKLNERQRNRLLHLLEHRQQWQRNMSIHEELHKMKLVEKVVSMTNSRMQTARLTTLGRNVAALILGAASLEQQSEGEVVGERLENDGGASESVL